MCPFPSLYDNGPPTDNIAQDVKDLQKGLGNALGGSLQNPLGKFTGNTLDDATKDFTGR